MISSLHRRQSLLQLMSHVVSYNVSLRYVICYHDYQHDFYAA